MTHIIRDAYIYLGDKAWAGRVEEVELPELEFDGIEIKALGTLGAQEFAGALQPLQGTMTNIGLDAGLMALILNPRQAQTMVLRSAIERAGPTGYEETAPVAWTLAPRFMKTSLGTLNNADALKGEIEFQTSLLTIEVDGVALLKLDVMNHVYEVNGVDVMKERRQAFGL